MVMKCYCDVCGVEGHPSVLTMVSVGSEVNGKPDQYCYYGQVCRECRRKIIMFIEALKRDSQ